jgi:hypothetical protein
MTDTMRVNLSRINSQAIQRAIIEYDKCGRRVFLKKYGFSRSSKFYLLHNERIYDTKPVVSAAYFYATGTKLPNNKFHGGPQTKTAIENGIGRASQFILSKIFEDKFGELRNLSGQFDRLPHRQSNLGSLGFSKWISLSQYKNIHTGGLPGVYVIAHSRSYPAKVSITSRHIVYIGETVSQTLSKRLHQFYCSLEGRGGHSGGVKLKGKFPHSELWISIRSFPLRSDVSKELARRFRSSEIRFLERMLLYEFVRTNRDYPIGNSK